MDINEWLNQEFQKKGRGYFDCQSVPLDSLKELLEERDRLRNDKSELLEQMLKQAETGNNLLHLISEQRDETTKELEAALRALRGEVGSPEDPGVLGVWPIEMANERDQLRAENIQMREALISLSSGRDCPFPGQLATRALQPPHTAQLARRIAAMERVVEAVREYRDFRDHPHQDVVMIRLAQLDTIDNELDALEGEKNE